MDPLVTFVVPCYNLAYLLPECLNSILVQTYPDFEVLVMDNCSPDNTSEVVRSFRDPRVKHVRNETNIGHTLNFNKGIAMARGKYVWLVSADDFLISPHALGLYVDVMERNPQVGYVFSCATTAHGANHAREVPSWAYCGKTDRIWKGHTFLRRLIRNNCIIMSSVMARKECYERRGLFAFDLPHANDWYMWCTLALHYDVAYFVEPMACCRVHGESLTAAFNRGNNNVCIADEINVLRSVARQAELAGLPSLRRACNASIASHVVQAMRSSPAGDATKPGLSESDLEELLQHKARDAKDEKDLRARLSVAIGDAAFWRGDRTRAIRSYSEVLKLRPWWVKSWAKYLLLRSGTVGVGARRLLTLACAVAGLRTHPGKA
ncbi:MAG TPA: glycosyltransferase [Terriglobia bacterium]|nr:glycosyltransferase [Terriglobia bacterium]